MYGNSHRCTYKKVTCLCYQFLPHRKLKVTPTPTTYYTTTKGIGDPD